MLWVGMLYVQIQNTCTQDESKYEVAVLKSSSVVTCSTSATLRFRKLLTLIKEKFCFSINCFVTLYQHVSNTEIY